MGKDVVAPYGYCDKCGTPNIRVDLPPDHYDQKTGKPVPAYRVQCPHFHMTLFGGGAAEHYHHLVGTLGDFAG